MKKRNALRSAFFNPRVLISFVFCAIVVSLALLIFALYPGGTALGAQGQRNPAGASQPRQLSVADRIAYQWAIEEVYWRHRIWPKENPAPKPSLDEVMPAAQIEQKVEDYLRNSQALEDYWQKPLTADQLQAEIERMAQHTRQPEVLRELFAALGNDPFVIAECLAKPALAERLVTKLYGHDQRFHGELRRRAELDLGAHHTVEQMKETSGNYREIELVRSDTAEADSAPADTKDAEAVRINSSEWQERGEKLAAEFDTANTDREPSATGRIRGSESSAPLTRSGRSGADPWSRIETGVLSPLQEDEWRYYTTAIIQKTKERVKLATLEWRKEAFDSWRTRADIQAPNAMAAATADYTLPVVLDDANVCTGDIWTATSTTNAPTGRLRHTAIWTGSEMIVWGGYNGSEFELNTGGKYNPATDSWTATSTTNAPTGRESHTAVWTGSEMIVWGGLDALSNELGTGGKYNPGTNSWTATSWGTTNAPISRTYHTAVWTGSEMIVWGGYNESVSALSTGGRYNPSTDSWTATNTDTAPAARYTHRAVWTGSEMIIWGGSNGPYFNTGGRYNPSTNSWTATSTTNAPAGRQFHVAVWSGSEMIVWGGYNGSYLNTGGRYNPGTDNWTATSATNAPSGRKFHTAVWTGSEMIVWGGFPVYLNTGGRYNPGTDSWIATSTTNAPAGRQFHVAVWSGSEMIVWGGYNGSYLNTGGRYCAQPIPAPTPTPTPATVSISGTVLYCSNPSLNPVPSVTLTLTGTSGGSTLSDGSGNYTFTGLVSGGSYTVTPSKSALAPGSAGITTMDVIAIQRHFLNLGTPLSGCRLTAADVNGSNTIDTIDVTAVQRFFLGLSTGIANTGKYQFNPANRSYPGITSNQTGQNYDVLIFGDVASPFADRADSSSPDSANETSAAEALPQ